MWLANLRFTQPSNELKMNNVMKGRDVATDIKVTIFSQTITGAMQTSHLPICYACPFMPNLSNGSFSRNRQNTKRKLRIILFFCCCCYFSA